MRNFVIPALISAGLIFNAVPSMAEVRTPHQRYEHRQHVKTAKRVGIGTVGGAVAGGLLGHPIAGAAAGAGAGALYDHHEKKQGK
jgi:uncharacterized membrane protein